MPVPLAPTSSPAALIAAHTAFRDLLDAGAGAGSIRIRSATDVLLAQIPLTDPCGTVNGTTGQLTLTGGADDAADASGTAAYGEFCDSAGLVHLSVPAQEGSASISGVLVINSLVVVLGGSVEVTSAVIG